MAWLVPPLKVRPKPRYWQSSCLEALGKIHFQAHSCCWQNSNPCGYGTKILASVLALSWEGLSASRPHPCPFQRCFSIFKPARAHQSFIGFEFLTSSSVTRWKKLSAFKGLMWLDTMFAFRDSPYLDASWSRNLILSEKHPHSSSETSVWRHVSTRARNGEQQS